MASASYYARGESATLPADGSRLGFWPFVRGKDKIATFTWKLLKSGSVEIAEKAGPDKPVTLTYLQFKNRSEAWFGASEDKLVNRLHVE